MVIPPDSKLLVICDGTYEVKKPDGQWLEFEEFKEFLNTHGRKEDVFQNLLGWVRSMNGPGPLADDFSMIRVHFS
jgi:serine phosphatase RsbU (regulator of sigma subunit)